MTVAPSTPRKLPAADLYARTVRCAIDLQGYWQGRGYQIDISLRPVHNDRGETVSWQIVSNLVNGLPPGFRTADAGKLGRRA